MLQTDLATLVDEGLEVLVTIVLIVLAAENHLDQLGVGYHLGTTPAIPGSSFECFDVLESSQAARDIACRERLAVQGGNHAYHVYDMSTFRSSWLDPSDLEVFLLELLPSLIGERTTPHPAAKFLGNGDAVDLGFGDN